MAPSTCLGILVLWERCNACGDCLTACTREMAQQGQPHPHVPRLHIPWQGKPAYVSLCRQCSQAPCKDACISGAIRLAEDGRVVLEDEACVGCWMCVTHCPFGALAVAGRKAVKCNVCVPEDKIPPCVSACPESALLWAPVRDVAITRGRDRARGQVQARLPA